MDSDPASCNRTRVPGTATQPDYDTHGIVVSGPLRG